MICLEKIRLPIINNHSFKLASKNNANFIKTFKDGKENEYLLEHDKTEIENMHSLLKKIDASVLLFRDINDYDDINHEFM